MKYLTFSQAIKEMKRGKFIHEKGNVTKGMYYFSNCPGLIGNNPNERIYIIYIGDSKVIDLNLINLKPIEAGFYFLSDFERKYTIHNLKIIEMKGGNV